jgi:hypothetical protein
MLNIFEYFTSFILFCVILFVYLHIQFHLKTSNDLELYEVEMCSKEKLDEMCDMRQPIVIGQFDECGAIVHETNLEHLVAHYSNFDMMVRDIQKEDETINSQLRIPLKLETLCSLFNANKDGEFITESNGEFLNDTGVIKHMQRNDKFMRPPMVMLCSYDIIAGGNETTTPLRYNINFRNFFVVTSGVLEVKLFPPKSSRYLHPIKDYVNFEYRSPVNPWSVQDKYNDNYKKIKYLEVKVRKGQTLYIPAYWWYSIKFSDKASVSTFSYKTYMNSLAILPELAMYGLQNQNITHKIMKNIGTVE